MKRQVIEIDGEAVGVVVPDEDSLRFMAVKYHVWDLDAQRFRSADEVRSAIRRLVASQAVSQSAVRRAGNGETLAVA